MIREDMDLFIPTFHGWREDKLSLGMLPDLNKNERYFIVFRSIDSLYDGNVLRISIYDSKYIEYNSVKSDKRLNNDERLELVEILNSKSRLSKEHCDNIWQDLLSDYNNLMASEYGYYNIHYTQTSKNLLPNLIYPELMAKNQPMPNYLELPD